MAKSALSDAGLKEYTLIEIENRDDCSDIQDYLLSLTGGRSVSVIHPIGSNFPSPLFGVSCVPYSY